MKIKIEDVKALRLYGTESEGSTLSLKVGKNGGEDSSRADITARVRTDGNG